MANTSNTSKLSKIDVFYYRQRNRNRIFSDICAFFAEEAAKNTNVTKRLVANKLGCDPALITRWLSTPSNLTVDTISDLLLALQAEMDYRIVRFVDRPKSNFTHPFIAELSDETNITDINVNKFVFDEPPPGAPGTSSPPINVKVLEPA